MLVPCPMCGDMVSPNAFDCVHCGEPLRGSIGDGEPGGMWRQGRTLVIKKKTRLPDRCVKSNVPTQRRLKRALSWHHSALFLVLLFLGPLIYIIVALVARKTATIRIGLSDEWFHKRRRATLFGWGSVVGGVILFIAGVARIDRGNSGGALMIAGFVVGLVGAIIGLIGARTVYATRITNTHIWLNGVCREYLEPLPEWHGRD